MSLTQTLRQLHRAECPNGVVVYQSEQLIQAGVAHGFSTRLGGVSLPPFDTLNLGNPQSCTRPDADEHIFDNYTLLQEAIGCAGHRRVAVHQVHGHGIVQIVAGQTIAQGTQADALISDDPGYLLSIRTADCVPILIASQDGRWVAAVHAGWRGVIARVVPLTVRAMVQHAEGGPENLLAAIGPCIGQDAFEAGPEVGSAFLSQFGAVAPLRAGRRDRVHVDLREAVLMQLLETGMTAERIAGTDRCTFRDKSEFFSHRRDAGWAGRHAAVIAPRARTSA